MITAKFDEESWKKKTGNFGPKIERLVKWYAEEVKSRAQQQLAPIYEDRRSWPVSGRLRGDIGIDPKIAVGGGKYIGVIYAPVPYARLRHYVNKAHPSTIGYFSKPLFKIRGPLRNSLKSLYKG